MTDTRIDDAPIAPITPTADSLSVVSCNHCGGALDVDATTRFTTCGYCGTRLRVERSATSLSTIELDDLRERTDDLERNVSVLRSDRRVEQHDRSWELRRDEFMITSGDSDPRLPTLHGALSRLIIALLPLGLVFSGWFASFGDSIVPIVLIVIVFGIGQAALEGFKYNRYRAARAEYRQQRAVLLAHGT